MRIHKSGTKTIVVNFIFWVAVVALLWLFCSSTALNVTLSAVALGMTVFMVAFFRIPDREIAADPSAVIAPADGRIILIKEVDEDEYFHDRRIRVSIFMSFFNVHVNWYPVSGQIRYVRYHPGGKTFAMHAKSSESNEHSSVVIRTGGGTEIMYRQIAGIVARRIVCDAEPGGSCEQGSQCGLIKFGSRVDIFLPPDSTLLVRRGDPVRGQITAIARIQ